MVDVTVEDCEIVIKKHLNTEDVTVANFNLVPLPEQNFELQVTVYHEKIKKNVSFFAKPLPDVPYSYRFIEDDLIPKIYHVTSELVIFEYLTPKGFQNCTGLLNLDQLFLVLKTLARLHAASLAFEETKSLRLDQEHALLHLNFKMKEVAHLIPPGLIQNLEERQFSSKFRKVLCHGNLISKNVMFRYEKGAPSECRLINLKCNFYAPPIYDILQLIFFNTSEDLRQHHLETLLFNYYEYLKMESKKHKISLDKIIPYQDFQISSHYLLPLIKLETVFRVAKGQEELQEIFAYPLISREDCYTIIKNKLGTTAYNLSSFKVTPLSDVSGFLGEYHRLEIHVDHLGEAKTINCFVKCSPKSGTPQEIARNLNTFSREVFMYQTLVPKMQNYGITTINNCLSPCYFQRQDDLMVFEDMALLNYQNLDALQSLDFPRLEMLIRKLSKFHACSLLLEEKVSEEIGKPYRLIEEYRQYFDEPLFFEDDHHLGARSFMTGVKSVQAAVDLFPEIKTDTNQNNFKKFWPKFKDLFYSVIKTSDQFRNVLCHGDLWTSNMMVNSDNDCVLIDFQIVRYCPPAYDLLSVLHLTTDRTTRLANEEKLIQIYYEELGKVLNSYGYSVDRIYPYQDFIGCIKHMKPQMVMQAAIDCVLTMCTPEEISSFLTDEETCRYVYFEDRTEFMTEMCKKSTLYRKRLGECLLDVYDYLSTMSIK